MSWTGCGFISSRNVSYAAGSERDWPMGTPKSMFTSFPSAFTSLPLFLAPSWLININNHREIIFVPVGSRELVLISVNNHMIRAFRTSSIPIAKKPMQIYVWSRSDWHAASRGMVQAVTMRRFQAFLQALTLRRRFCCSVLKGRIIYIPQHTFATRLPYLSHPAC